MENPVFEEDEESIVGGHEREAAFSKQMQCMMLSKPRTSKKEHHSWWKHPTTTKLEKQLQARWKSEELIEHQLENFLDFYRNPSTPTTLRQVSDILSPGHIPLQEQATLTWFGDWRPSAILELLGDRALSSPESDQTLSHLINDVAIEESIIDSELAEIQATCIFHFPFAPASRSRALDSVVDEFRKLGGVIVRAQQLRFKTLQTAVKRVLTPTEGAEFLVAFAGLQNGIRHVAAELRARDPAVLSLPFEQFKG